MMKLNKFMYRAGCQWLAVLAVVASMSYATATAGRDSQRWSRWWTNADIVEKLENDGRFSTLLAALEMADLKDTLAGEGAFTLLAPTDDAFAAVPDDLPVANHGLQPCGERSPPPAIQPERLDQLVERHRNTLVLEVPLDVRTAWHGMRVLPGLGGRLRIPKLPGALLRHGRQVRECRAARRGIPPGRQFPGSSGRSGARGCMLQGGCM